MTVGTATELPEAIMKKTREDTVTASELVRKDYRASTKSPVVNDGEIKDCEVTI